MPHSAPVSMPGRVCPFLLFYMDRMEESDSIPDGQMENRPGSALALGRS